MDKNSLKIPSKWKYPLLLWVISIFLLFPGITGDSLLLQGDEVMHLKTIRESIESKSYLHPELGGYSNPYKPPLLFWTGMLGNTIFGVGLLGERFPSVLLGAFSVVLVFLVLTSLGVRSFLSFGIGIGFLTSLGIFKFSRLAMMEIYLVFFLLLGLYFYIRYLLSGKNLFFILSAFAVGLGALLKGPILLVYFGIILLTHWMLGKLRIRRGRTVWVGRRTSFLVLSGPSLKSLAFIWGPISLLPLILWFLAIILWTDQGLAFVKFFMGTENFGKFGSENQPEGRLALGLIGYTLPWSVLFLVGSWKIFFQKEKSRKQFIAKWLLLSAVYIFLLHLVPNRKDAYYTLPSIALGCIALGLGLRHTILRKMLRSPIHVGFQILLATLLFIGSLFLENRFPFLFLIPFGFIFYGMFAHWYLKKERLYGVSSGVLAPIVMVLFFQVFLLPSVPNRIPILDPNEYPEVCIISKNPWDAWEIENYSIGVTATHSPFITKSCMEGGKPILFFEGTAISEDLPSGYFIDKSWKLWAGNLPDLTSGFPRIDDPSLYKTVFLYSKSSSNIGEIK